MDAVRIEACPLAKFNPNGQGFWPSFHRPLAYTRADRPGGPSETGNLRLIVGTEIIVRWKGSFIAPQHRFFSGERWPHQGILSALLLLRLGEGGLRVLGRVDGFDDDEAQSKCDEGSEVLVRFLAAERNALEALELADEVFDAGAGAIERLREESRPVLGR